jgi:GNAT superfamily N-acetyltransferase
MADLEIERLDPGDAVAAGAWVAIYNAVLPEMAFGVDDFLYGQQRDPDGVDLVARIGGRAVGCGNVTPLRNSTTAYVWFGVLEEERRQGVGTALYQAFRAAARAIGRDTFQTRVSEARPETIAFLGRRGLAEAARHQEVALDLSAIDPPPVALPPGLRLSTLAAEPALEDATFEVARQVIPEIPAPEPRPVTRSRWDAWMHGPQMRPDAVFLAVEGDRVVAYAALLAYEQQPGDAIHEITAVLPDYRRRGIARALKAAEIAWAREAGFERLRAHNDSTNIPIRRLNDELGYRPLPARIVLRGPVDP